MANKKKKWDEKKLGKGTGKSRLPIKQQLVIADQIKRIQDGGSVSLADSFEKIYDVSSRASAKSMASNYYHNSEQFRNALIDGLINKNIIGADSKVEKRLREGLDATKESREGGDRPDYRARLSYAQEINKIAGVYAPEKKETKKMTLNVDMSSQELDKKIEQLNKELQEN